MSDWDLIDNKKNVPRNDPRVERKQSFSNIEAQASQIIESGTDTFQKIETLSRYSQKLSRNPKNSYIGESLKNSQRARSKERPLVIAPDKLIKTLPSEGFETQRQRRRLFKKRIKQTSTPLITTKESPLKNLTTVNIVLFFIGIIIFSDFFKKFSGVTVIIVYLALWFVTRHLAKIFLKKFSNE